MKRLYVFENSGNLMMNVKKN